MNLARITPNYIALHYINMNLHTLYMPERVRLMTLWVAMNHDDFLEEYYEMFDEDGEWLGHVTREQIKAMNAKKERLAKEFKKNFPEVKQQNVMYDNIMEILKELVFEQNE